MSKKTENLILFHELTDEEREKYKGMFNSRDYSKSTGSDGIAFEHKGKNKGVAIYYDQEEDGYPDKEGGMLLLGYTVAEETDDSITRVGDALALSIPAAYLLYNLLREAFNPID